MHAIFFSIWRMELGASAAQIESAIVGCRDTTILCSGDCRARRQGHCVLLRRRRIDVPDRTCRRVALSEAAVIAVPTLSSAPSRIPAALLSPDRPSGSALGMAHSCSATSVYFRGIIGDDNVKCAAQKSCSGDLRPAWTNDTPLTLCGRPPLGSSGQDWGHWPRSSHLSTGSFACLLQQQGMASNAFLCILRPVPNGGGACSLLADRP